MAVDWKSQAYTLSDGDMHALLPGVPITLYPELKGKRLGDLVDARGRGLILFEEDETPSAIQGHWLAIASQPNGVLLFDPYGGKQEPWMLDHTFVSARTLKRLHEERPLLVGILREAGVKPVYSPHRYQNMRKGVNTCGRHCVVRLWNHHMTVDEYDAFMGSQGDDSDTVVTRLTNAKLAATKGNAPPLGTTNIAPEATKPFFNSHTASSNTQPVFYTPPVPVQGGASRYQRFQATKAAYKKEPVEIKGLQLLKQTPTEVAYLDPATGKIVISIRGSYDLQDWTRNNSRIPAGQLMHGPRYKKASAFVEEIRRAYPDNPIEAVTGHSLGGAIATELRRQFGPTVIPEVIVWNPANQPEDHKRGKEEGITRIHQTNDALVRLPEVFGMKDAQWLNGRPLANEIHSTPTDMDMVTAHGLDSFNSSEYAREHGASADDIAYAKGMMGGARRPDMEDLGPAAFGPFGEPPPNSNDGIVANLINPSQQLYIQNRAKRVTGFIIARAPIAEALNTLLEVTSGGTWKQAQKQAGIDAFFHLCVWVQLEDGTQLTVEKLALVTISAGYNYTSNAHLEQRSIPVTGPFTLQDMFVNAVKKVGAQPFWQYDALRGQNCQDLVNFLVQGSRAFLAVTPADVAWYKQDVVEIAKKLPGFARIARAATDLGASVSRAADATGLAYLPDAFSNAAKAATQAGQSVVNALSNPLSSMLGAGVRVKKKKRVTGGGEDDEVRVAEAIIKYTSPEWRNDPYPSKGSDADKLAWLMASKRPLEDMMHEELVVQPWSELAAPLRVYRGDADPEFDFLRKPSNATSYSTSKSERIASKFRKPWMPEGEDEDEDEDEAIIRGIVRTIELPTGTSVVDMVNVWKSLPETNAIKRLIKASNLPTPTAYPPFNDPEFMKRKVEQYIANLAAAPIPNQAEVVVRQPVKGAGAKRRRNQ